MELISVIVPVYNVKAYLGRCVRSIQAQTYADIEILLVDDGSTDGSGELCDEFAHAAKNIRVIHNQNGGLSSARNAGIGQAKGGFLCFIDSDDVISSDYVGYLYSLCTQHSCDVAMGGFQVFFEQIAFPNPCGGNVRILSGRQALRELLGPNYVEATIACNKLYRREVFGKLRYPEGLINEDEAVAYRIYDSVNKVAFSDAVIYGYYQRENSITKTKFSTRNFDYLQIAEERACYFERKGDKEFHHLFQKEYCWALLTFAKRSRQILKDKAREKELIAAYRKESRVLLRSPYLSLKRRGALWLLRAVPRAFDLLRAINSKMG